VHNATAVLQVNPNHPILKKLKAKIDLNEAGDDEATRTAQLLFNVAALRGGYEIEDGKLFATLVTELMAE
jgi:HSP90 family molecular chaperone